MRLTGYAFDNVIFRTSSDFTDLFERIAMSTEEGTVTQLVEETVNSGNFLAGSLSNNGRKNGRGESTGLTWRVEGAEVKELAEENELRLCVRLYHMRSRQSK